jgi:hypothetical protein
VDPLRPLLDGRARVYDVGWRLYQVGALGENYAKLPNVGLTIVVTAEEGEISYIIAEPA